jgi:uncharacterized membrane protein
LFIIGYCQLNLVIQRNGAYPQVLCLLLWCLAHKFQIVQGITMELIDVLLN